MSVRVNLLPREVELRARERRIALGSATGLAIWVTLLVLLFVQQIAAVAHARNVRADEEVELARLQARVTELAPYQALAQRFDSRNQILAAAMDRQIAWSGVLNDFALVFPSSGSLLTLAAVGGDTAIGGGVGEAPTGVPSIQYTGYSVERYAPGVESVLLGLDDALAFEGLYLANASRLAIGDSSVTNFVGSGRLTESVYTHRFGLGLPEGER